MVSPDYITRNGIAFWREDSIQCSSPKIVQFTGVYDKYGTEMYSDDVISDGKNNYRIYAMPGGFTIKATFWSAIMDDVRQGDELIMDPLSDVQTISYIAQLCEVVGNIYANPELLKP
jgi:uncharacterized phage protein (TIGR01671 family)